MASGSRTLKLQILADVDNLTKSLKTGSTDVDSFGSKMADFGKKAAAAFAVAAAAAVAYAGKLAIDGVKSAIEDQAAQEKLATTLRNVTQATNIQIAATEDYISKTALATGVADDELRPALDRLVRATDDVTKSQDLLNLALDVSAGTGKSLDSVVQALGKAYEGNTTSLGRLGVGIDKTELSTMSFEEITAKLATTFKDQASVQAETFEGKMARLQVAVDEAKESVGFMLLDSLEPMVDYIIAEVVPAFEMFLAALGGKDPNEGLDPQMRKVNKAMGIAADEDMPAMMDAAYDLGESIKELVEKISNLFDRFNKSGEEGSGAGFIRFLEKISDLLGTIIDAFDYLLTLNDKIDAFFDKYTFGINPTEGLGQFFLKKLADQIGFSVGGSAASVNGVTLEQLNAALETTTVMSGVNTNYPAVQKLLEQSGYSSVEALTNALTGGFQYTSNGQTTGMSQITEFTPELLAMIPAGTNLGASTAAAQAFLEQQQRLLETGFFEVGNQAAAAQYQANIDKVQNLLSASGVPVQSALPPTYNITVNGAIDAEASARQIVGLIQDSAARTGNYTTLGIAPLSLASV